MQGNFTDKLINRQSFPDSHLLVAEDDIYQQRRIIEHLESILEPQGSTLISCVSGGKMAASVISGVPVDLIILDHDMPWGDGSELIKWMILNNMEIPIVTFSGIPINNQRMRNLLTNHVYEFTKEQVIGGEADKIILDILRNENKKH